MRLSITKIVGWLRSPGDKLGERAIHGGIWATFLNFIDRGLQSGRLILLAILLGPSEIGLYGISLLVISTADQLLNLNLKETLIQRGEEDIDSFLDTAWVINLSRGVGLAIIIILMSPTIADLFADPRVTPIVRVIALSLLLRGCFNPAVVYFRKDIEFQKEFVYKLSGSLPNFVVAVAAGYYLRSVWALIFGILAGNALQLLASYVLIDYRPRWSFDSSKATQLMDIGKWLWATTIIGFLTLSFDDMFVGWYLGAASLGFYQVAFRLANAPASEVTSVISSVVLPMYSKLQEDRERLQIAFYSSMRLVMLIAVPMAIGIALVAKEFTLLIFGPEWSTMVPAMQIIAISSLIHAIIGMGGALFVAHGSPDWKFRVNAVRFGLILVTVWPLTELYGIAGVALSITIGLLGALPIWFYKTREITGLSYEKYSKSFGIPLFSSLLMALPVWWVKSVSIVGLVLAIILGVMVYAITVHKAYSKFGGHPVQEVFRRVSNA